MDELTSRTALCSSVASRYSTIAASVPSPARSTRPYCFGSSGSNESTVATASFAPVRVDELAEEPSSEQRRVPGEHEDVVGTALESSACAAHRVTRPARLLLYRDLDPVEGGGRRGRRDDDDRIHAESPGRGEHPVDHPPAEDRMQVLGDVGAHPRAESGRHHDGSERPLTVRRHGGWGARIRTWDHGTKTRCLTTWPRPNSRAILPLTIGRPPRSDARRTTRRHPRGPRRPESRSRAPRTARTPWDLRR